MFTSTMSNQELVSEAAIDLQYINTQIAKNIALGRLDRLRRRTFKKIQPRKRKQFEICYNSEVQTIKGNSWNCNVSIRYRNCFWRSFCKFVDTRNYKVITKSLDDILIANGHFFSRYKSRFLDCRAELKLLPVLDTFFQRNIIHFSIPNYIGDAKTSSSNILFRDGVGLCYEDEDQGVLDLKTFISFDQMKKTQLDQIVEAVKDIREFQLSNPGDKSNAWKYGNERISLYLADLSKQLKDKLVEYN